jgi:hypothetical protein
MSTVEANTVLDHISKHLEDALIRLDEGRAVTAWMTLSSF